LASYFSINKALLRENLKRYWVIPAFTLLVLFFSGIFPLLISSDYNYGSYNGLYHQRISFLLTAGSFSNAGFITMTILTPLMACIALNRYLYAARSVSLMHSLPITRGRMFATNTVTALAVTWIPFIAVFAVMQLFVPSSSDYVKESSQLYGSFTQNTIAAADAATYLSTLRADLWGAMWLTLLVSGLYIVLFNAAAMVVGNTIMHVIVCGFISAIPSLLVLGVGGLCQLMLFGFTLNESFAEVCMSLAPIVYVPMSGTGVDLYGLGSFFTVVIVCYIVLVPLFYALGAFLYSRRQLERAGDSIVYRFAEVGFVSVITFGGSMAFGALFSLVNWGSFPLNTGTFIGGAVAFIIAKMIAQKTLRIWNKVSLIHCGGTAVGIALLLGVIGTGAFGYSTRVPGLNRVESVSINSYTLASARSGVLTQNDFSFSDPENIKQLLSVHSTIVNDLDAKYYNYETNIFYSTGRYYEPMTDVLLTYRLKSGGTMSRRWSVPSTLLTTPELDVLLASNEFRAQNSVKTWIDGADIRSLQLSTRASWIYGASSDITLSSDDTASFIAALDADLAADSHVPQRYQSSLLGVSISILRNPETYNSYLSLDVPNTYQNTNKWLKLHNYYDRIIKWNNDIDSIKLTHYIVEENPNPGRWDSIYRSQSAVETLTVTDRADIDFLLSKELANADYTSDYWQAECYDNDVPPEYNDRDAPVSVYSFILADEDVAKLQR
jgi:ABC-2 type transport system permease protein